MNSLGWRPFRRDPLRSIGRVGNRIQVDGPLVVRNDGEITIGNDVHIRAEPAVSHLVTGRDGVLTIADGVFIGHGAAIAAHVGISIGAGTWIGPYAMLMDTDFHQAGSVHSAGATGRIRIGAQVVMGARVIVLRGAEIGDGAQIAPGSVVRGVVPPGAHVAGSPAKVVQPGIDQSAAN